MPIISFRKKYNHKEFISQIFEISKIEITGYEITTVLYTKNKTFLNTWAVDTWTISYSFRDIKTESWSTYKNYFQCS